MDHGSWWAPIDAYCERADASFWSEPVNAVSSAAFLLAAAYAFGQWRRVGANDWPGLGLILLAAVVGIGSFLFHTFANRWSLIADVLPIMLFILAYFFLAMRRFFGLGLLAALLLTGAFQGATMAFAGWWAKVVVGPDGVDPVNGSAGYFPPAVLLVVVGGVMLAGAARARGQFGSARSAASRARSATGRALLAAAAVFLVSLVLRSIDQRICAAFALGTHFLWHGLNAVVLMILLRAVILFPGAKEGANREV
jgi:hypothetical protein